MLPHSCRQLFKKIIKILKRVLKIVLLIKYEIPYHNQFFSLKIKNIVCFDSFIIANKDCCLALVYKFFLLDFVEMNIY